MPGNPLHTVTYTANTGTQVLGDNCSFTSDRVVEAAPLNSDYWQGHLFLEARATDSMKHIPVHCWAHEKQLASHLLWRTGVAGGGRNVLHPTIVLFSLPF